MRNISRDYMRKNLTSKIKKGILVASLAGMSAMAISGCKAKTADNSNDPLVPAVTGVATNSDAGNELIEATEPTINLKEKNENVPYLLSIDDAEPTDITKYVRDFKNEMPYISVEGMGKIFGMTKTEVTQADKDLIRSSESIENIEDNANAEYAAFAGNGKSFVFKEGSPVILNDGYPAWNGESTAKQNDELSVSLMSMVFAMGYERVGCTTTADNKILFTVYSPGAYDVSTETVEAENVPTEDETADGQTAVAPEPMETVVQDDVTESISPDEGVQEAPSETITDTEATH